jgi:hypothetical protein
VYVSAVVNEFSEYDQTNPNCVVLGDAKDEFTYQRLNHAFKLLLEQPGTSLISMGKGYVKNGVCIFLKTNVFFVNFFNCSGSFASFNQAVDTAVVSRY